MDYLLRKRWLTPDMAMETRRKFVPIMRGEPTQDAVNALMASRPQGAAPAPVAPRGEGPVPSDRIQRLLSADPGDVLGAYNQENKMPAPDDIMQLLHSLQYGGYDPAGYGSDPRAQAIAKMMQMQGADTTMPPAMSQAVGRRGAVRAQTPFEQEQQTQDLYNTSREAKQAVSENTYGRVPPPPDPNEAFGGTPKVTGQPKSMDELRAVGAFSRGLPDYSAQERLNQQGLTTEQELDLVHKGMDNQNGDDNWEGDPVQQPQGNQQGTEGEPTDKDIQKLKANPNLIDSFISYFGEDAVPNDFQQPDQADDYRGR